MRHWLILLLIAPTLALADAASDTDMTLSVKPVLCITDARSPSCDIAFLVAWESEHIGHYCLYNDFANEALRCWTDRRDGQLSDGRVVDETFRYWMTGDDATVKLAEVAVEVLRLDSDDRRRKRRTRHVWDIN